MEPYATSDVAMLKGYIPQNCESVMFHLVVPVFISLLFLSHPKLLPAIHILKAGMSDCCEGALLFL